MPNRKLLNRNTITDLPTKIPIWVINRERDTERLNSFRQECMKIGFTDVIRWTAMENKRGQTGLGLTLISMFNAAHTISVETRGPELCLIFEDDCRFTCAQSWMWFWKMWHLLPPDWDVLLGGAYGVTAKDIPSTPYLKKVEGFSGCHMVLWNSKAMRKVLADYDPHSPKAVSHIDRFLEKSGLNIYLCDPQVAVQEAGLQSTIGPGIVPDRFSRQNLLTPYVYRDELAKIEDNSVVFRTEAQGRN
jgi:hypothetical protein